MVFQAKKRHDVQQRVTWHVAVCVDRGRYQDILKDYKIYKKIIAILDWIHHRNAANLQIETRRASRRRGKYYGPSNG